jgi:hypothetical protein
MIRPRCPTACRYSSCCGACSSLPRAKSHRQRSKRNQWSGELHLRPGGQPQADDLNARAGASGPVELRRQRSLHGGDTYDNNGNTASSGGIANVYDFENHLIQKGGATIVYDGNGNRVGKTVADVTTTYLVLPGGHTVVNRENQATMLDTFATSGGRQTGPLYVLAWQQQSTHGIFPEVHSPIGDTRVGISCYKLYPNTAAVARGPDDRVCNHLPLRRERRARRGVCGLDAPSDLIFGGSPRHCGPAFPRYYFAVLRHRRGSHDSSVCALPSSCISTCSQSKYAQSDDLSEIVRRGVGAHLGISIGLGTS